MTKNVLLIFSYLLLAVSVMATMNPLSDIVRQCFAYNHQFIQINYIHTQRDDDSMYNMVEIVKGNQQQFLGSSDW